MAARDDNDRKIDTTCLQPLLHQQSAHPRQTDVEHHASAPRLGSNRLQERLGGGVFLDAAARGLEQRADRPANLAVVFNHEHRLVSGGGRLRVAVDWRGARGPSLCMIGGDSPRARRVSPTSFQNGGRDSDGFTSCRQPALSILSAAFFP